MKFKFYLLLLPLLFSCQEEIKIVKEFYADGSVMAVYNYGDGIKIDSSLFYSQEGWLRKIEYHDTVEI
ncbi:hypothetical protein OAB54_03415 [Flavobacteriaceae bacterium]|nr:hypothetical protein [Flavobacteriaceae bacterium]